MAFTVETGTGNSAANSLVAVGTADTYHADRGNTAWAALSNPNKEAALIKATDYLRNAAVFPWKGILQFSAQALPWPRTGVTATDGLAVPPDSVPLSVQQAAADLALISTTMVLQPVVQAAPSGVKRKKVDALETEYFSATESANAGDHAADTLVTTSAMGLLRPLLRIAGTLGLAVPYANLPTRADTTRASRPLFYTDQLANKG